MRRADRKRDRVAAGGATPAPKIDPGHRTSRSRRGSARRSAGAGVMASGAILLGTIAMLAVGGYFAWRSLQALPPKAALESASEVIARETPVLVGRSSSPPAQPEPRHTAVRAIERDGIVGPRVSGELERTAALEPEGPPIPPPSSGPERDVYRLVVIESAGTIDARTHHMRLAHIAAPDAERICRRADGSEWPCGKRARTALRRLVRRRALECLDVETETATATATATAQAPSAEPAPAEPAPPREANCAVAGIDLSRWLVEQGWAIPDKGAPKEWDELHAHARREGLGLFSPSPR